MHTNGECDGACQCAHSVHDVPSAGISELYFIQYTCSNISRFELKPTNQKCSSVVFPGRCAHTVSSISDCAGYGRTCVCCVRCAVCGVRCARCAWCAVCGVRCVRCVLIENDSNVTMQRRVDWIVADNFITSSCRTFRNVLAPETLIRIKARTPKTAAVIRGLINNSDHCTAPSI